MKTIPTLTEAEILADPELLLEASLQTAWDEVDRLKRVIRWHTCDKRDKAYAKECRTRIMGIILAIKTLEAMDE